MSYRSTEQKVFISPPQGMNQNISDEILPPNKFCYYMENMLSEPLGQGSIRFGTTLDFDRNQSNYSVIRMFPFQKPNGSNQVILYSQVYKTFTGITNLIVNSENSFIVDGGDLSLFKEQTYLLLRYRSNQGITSPIYYFIEKINDVGDPEHPRIEVILQQNSFPDNLHDYYIEQDYTSITYINTNFIQINLPEGYDPTLYYHELQNAKLIVDDQEYLLFVPLNGVDTSVDGQVTLGFTESTVPPFDGSNDVHFYYGSETPEITSLSYASGLIEIYDSETDSILDGADQKIENLSVACVPRGDYIDKKFWICNGVDKIMTWDGTKLEVYREFVKEFAQSFNRIDDTHFSFISNAAFIIGKYVPGEPIALRVSGATTFLTVTSIGIVGQVITITTVETIPAFTGSDRLELFYSDSPPPFSFIKAVYNRIYALGPGPVGLKYRVPDEALRFYVTYTTSVDLSGFRFFNEVTKTVPSFEISGTHEGADNLEAIATLPGQLLLMGRERTQAWVGTDPINKQSPDVLKHGSTRNVGIYHGDLLVDLDNDVAFIGSGRHLSFSTLNVAKQVAATSINAVDPLIKQHIRSINESDYAYRACQSFKYKNGTFGGFKIGLNDYLVSKYEKQFYSWGIFSGDFSKSTSILNNTDGILYLSINDKIYYYADGNKGTPVYGDKNGTELILFAISWPSNNKMAWSNKRYRIKTFYSSSVVVNKKNYVNILINGDLRKTFNIQDEYNFEFRGDLLNTVPLGDSGNNDADQIGFRLESAYKFPENRLRFVSENFFVTLIGQVMNGPFSLKELTLYGESER